MAQSHPLQIVFPCDIVPIRPNNDLESQLVASIVDGSVSSHVGVVALNDEYDPHPIGACTW